MRSRDVLAANFRKLRERNPKLWRYQDITAVSGISNGTLGRIGSARVATSIDVLDQLAEVYGVEPSELISPTMGRGKAAMPSAYALEVAWLFDEAIKGMGPIDRARVYQAVQEAIARQLVPRDVQPTDTQAAPAPDKKQPG